MTGSLPTQRGPLSSRVITGLAEGRPIDLPEARQADPYGEDLQLALYLCYELHYRGFRDVDPEREWDPDLLRARQGMEGRFLAALRADLPGASTLDAALDPLLVEQPGAYGVSHHLCDVGEPWQLQEYIAHRSIYHLKEAEPHAWVIPRLQGRAKAAIVAVEFDEFGGGRPERMHSALFADLMADVGLDPSYGRYLDVVPAPALAIVNMMSLFGLHRALRGALVGHFAAAEITTPPGARRMAQALRRLGAGHEAIRFYTEHVEADAVHEQVLRHDVLADLLANEPHLADDVILGIQATQHLEQRLDQHILDAWTQGHSSLRPGRPAPTLARD